MSWIVVAILSVLWVLGVLTSNTAGGFIHVLLLLALVVLLVRLKSGPRLSS